jgi:predicted XRE-type DNA-binding protein
MEITDADILEAISTDPVEFADMVLRVDIMLTLADSFQERDLSHAQISEILEISAPWVNELLELNIDMFSTEELQEFCAKAGVRFESLLEQVRFS